MSGLGFVYRNIFYKTTYFLDTNFVISKDGDLDTRFKKIHIQEKNSFVTEPISREIKELCGRGGFTKVVSGDIRTISFNDLYVMHRDICPVYHNLLGAMHNPALITSSDFLLQTFFAKITKGERLDQEEQLLYSDIVSRMTDSAKNDTFSDGTKKDRLSKILEEAHVRSIRKRTKGLKGKDKNYPNDIRNLALIISYTLLVRQNVVVLTTDSDALSYFFDGLFTLVQEVDFKHHSLLELSKNDNAGMKKLAKKKKVVFHFDAQWIQREVDGTIQRFITNYPKFFSPRLTIRYWDKKQKRFFEVGVNLDYSMRTLFLYAHGNLNCPTAKNNVMGAFISTKYWWPPSPTENPHLFKIELSSKPVYRESEILPPEIHDQACLYRRNDLKANYGAFSSFLEPDT